MAKVIDIKNILLKKMGKKAFPKKLVDLNSKSFSILKVTVSDSKATVKGNPYRVLSIPTIDSLDALADAILDSFDFDSDHMYGFYDNLKNWTKSEAMYTMDDDGYEDSSGSTAETLIGEVFSTPKKKMLFLFDYGDEWRFIVELLRVETPEGKTKLATTVIESNGDSPEQYPDYEA